MGLELFAIVILADLCVTQVVLDKGGNCSSVNTGTGDLVDATRLLIGIFCPCFGCHCLLTMERGFVAFALLYAAMMAAFFYSFFCRCVSTNCHPELEAVVVIGMKRGKLKPPVARKVHGLFIEHAISSVCPRTVSYTHLTLPTKA